MKSKKYLIAFLLFFTIWIGLAGITKWQCADDDIWCQKAQFYNSPEYKEANDPAKDGWTLQEVEVTWKRRCKWISLNTNMPFVGNCIQTYESKSNKNWDRVVTPINAFPVLIWSLMNLLMTIILIMSLLMIVRSWVLMTMGWMDAGKYTKWVQLLTRVVKGMALLGASWVILKVINPNFFV